MFLEIGKSFQLMPKGLEAKKKYCMGGVISKDFKKKSDGNLRDMESKCRDLLLEEHCKNLFDLMNYNNIIIIKSLFNVGYKITHTEKFTLIAEANKNQP